jgi:hypothetical protein
MLAHPLARAHGWLRPAPFWGCRHRSGSGARLLDRKPHHRSRNAQRSDRRTERVATVTRTLDAGARRAIERRIRNARTATHSILLSDRFGTRIAGNLGCLARPPRAGRGWVEIELIRTAATGSAISAPRSNCAAASDSCGRDASARMRFDRVLGPVACPARWPDCRGAQPSHCWLLTALSFGGLANYRTLPARCVGDLTRRIPGTRGRR